MMFAAVCDSDKKPNPQRNFVSSYKNYSFPTTVFDCFAAVQSSALVKNKCFAYLIVARNKLLSQYD